MSLAHLNTFGEDVKIDPVTPSTAERSLTKKENVEQETLHMDEESSRDQ